MIFSHIEPAAFVSQHELVKAAGVTIPPTGQICLDEHQFANALWAAAAFVCTRFSEMDKGEQIEQLHKSLGATATALEALTTTLNAAMKE